MNVSLLRTAGATLTQEYRFSRIIGCCLVYRCRLRKLSFEVIRKMWADEYEEEESDEEVKKGGRFRWLALLIGSLPHIFEESRLHECDMRGEWKRKERLSFSCPSPFSTAEGKRPPPSFETSNPAIQTTPLYVSVENSNHISCTWSNQEGWMRTAWTNKSRSTFRHVSFCLRLEFSRGSVSCRCERAACPQEAWQWSCSMHFMHTCL